MMKPAQRTDDELWALARAGRPSGDCPDLLTLAAFADGTLPGGERAAAESHLAGCDSCLDAVLLAVERPRMSGVGSVPRRSWTASLALAASLAAMAVLGFASGKLTFRDIQSARAAAADERGELTMGLTSFLEEPR